MFSDVEVDLYMMLVMNTHPHNNPLGGKAIFDIFFSLLFPKREERRGIKRYHYLLAVSSHHNRRHRKDDVTKPPLSFSPHLHNDNPRKGES